MVVTKEICKLVITYFYCYTVHVVELLNYHTNHCTYIKFIKFYTLKSLKTFRHVSVLRPSSGSYNSLAKVTLEIVINFVVPVGYCGSMPCCVMLCCEECPATDVHCVYRCVIRTLHNTACCHNTQLVKDINMWLFLVWLYQGRYSSLRMVLGPKHVGAFLMF
jgi:hypothetical protein